MALLYILVVLANVVCFVTGLSLELVAGNLTITQSVENVPGTLSGLSNTTGLWAESDGNLYIADSGNFKVRMLDSNGIIATTFGTGNQSDDGTDGTYRAVTFDGVHSVQVDRNYIFITSGNYFIWKYQPGKTGPVLRIAGATPATRGYGGDGGDPKLAILNQPMGLYVTTTNLLYFADYGNDRIRVINDDTNIITTVAGNGVAAFSGDGGPATSASLSKPTSVWMDNGYLYITDTGNNCIRMFDLSSNIIQTFLSGLNQPTNIVFDSAHTAYYSEPCRIMKYDGTTASLYIGSSSCGVQQGYERIATNDDISAPRGLAADVNGVLYFSEMNIIRKYSSLEAPSRTPTRTPSRSPTISSAPFPTTSPTLNSSPTRSPTLNSSPTRSPTLNSSPTHSPTLNSSPTHSPTLNSSPTRSPTLNSSPTRSPTLNSSPTRSPTLNSSPTRSPTLTSKPSSLSPSFRPSTSNMNSTSLSSSKSERLSDINIFYVTFFPAFFVLMILITFLICCYCYGAKFPNELYGKKDKKYEKVEKSGDHSATNVVDRQRFYELSF